MLDNERDDALFALAVLARCRRQACWSVEVRARMVCLLTTWRDQVTLSQVVDEQRSSHTVRIYDRTSGGQLQMIILLTIVQWFAAPCRAC